MGQEQYIIRTGVGFDVDRRSGQQALGIMESIADGMNTMQMRKSVEGIQARNSQLDRENQKLEKKNKDATKKRMDDITNSAAATAEILQSKLPEEPEHLTPKTKVATKAWLRWKAQMDEMGSSYEKFSKRAEKAGMKVHGSLDFGKSGRPGSPEGISGFMKEEASDRQRQIVLMKRMIDENEDLIKVKGKGADEARKDNEFLKKEMRNLISLDKEALALEKEEGKTKKKNYREYSKEAKKLHKQNRQELQNIKTREAAYKKMGAAAQNYVSGLAGGMKNAFVIGTAAAAAFAYKLQPVVEEVMLFEKTIVNANSVFGESNEKLHEVSDSLVSFGLQYGVSTNEAAEGLYQLASAGLSAAESQEVLQHTLKLAMATQGDHNTLAKLTVQTIKGFGMEMSDAEMLTDKFAHSIQKSLIEWQDLSSSVKFAMPFFTATGQSIDQLLGGLEVLTNRALEAGIAGRGLRQALAQFAKHSDSNESAFRKLGIEIMDAEGNMKELTTIAMEAKKAFGDVTDLEALTAMLEDMNVRGATAFALLVQNAEEYQQSVVDLSNAQGEATRMADIQQESLANQMQRVKNALMAPFFFSDKIGEAGNSLNEFTLQIKELTDEFVGFLIIEEDGEYKLNDFAYQVQDFVVVALGELLEVVKQLKVTFLEASGSDGGLETFTKLLQLSTKPMMYTLKILDRLGPNFLTMMVYYKVLAKFLPITTIMSYMQARAQMTLGLAIMGKVQAQKEANDEEIESLTIGSLYLGQSTMKTAANIKQWLSVKLLRSGIIQYTIATKSATLTTKGMMLAMGASIGLMMAAVNTTGILSDALTVMAGIMLVVAAYNTLKDWPFPANLAAAAGLVAGAFVMRSMIRSAFGIGGDDASAVDAETIINAGSMGDTRQYDLGGVYIPTADNGGGPTQDHGLAYLQKGETVIPKTQNMLGGGGITVNMGDVNAQDGTDFAEKLADALPEAIRRQNDIGAI